MTSVDRGAVAVIGSGVAGLTAAYVLSRNRRVTLYEADNRLGGHAHTHAVEDPAGVLKVDSGFIVHNRVTYPYLCRLFAELGVATRPCPMSMSVVLPERDWEFSNGGIAGVVAGSQGRSPAYWRLLIEVPRFQAAARELLRAPLGGQEITFGEFLAAGGFSSAFVEAYALPVVSCVWSSGTGTATAYPARYLFRFLDNHGMLRLRRSPRWYTVTGGSATYVQAVADRLTETRTSTEVLSLRRNHAGCTVTEAGGTEVRYSAAVLATHADQALELLADASPEETEVLSAFSYTRNQTVLHTDSTLLPDRVAARASWNYRVDPLTPTLPVTTYWMNRLQGLDAACDYLVTLNGDHLIDPDQVITTMTYEHPVYDRRAVEAQTRLAGLNTPSFALAGSYHGWGFHEDGCRSGVQAAAALGSTW